MTKQHNYNLPMIQAIEPFETRVSGAPVGMPEVVAFASLGRNLTGPRKKPEDMLVSPDVLYGMLPDDVDSKHTRDIIDDVASMVDRRMRYLQSDASVYLRSQIVDSVARITRKVIAEKSSSTKKSDRASLTEQNKAGIARLVRDMELSRALHYLDEEFVWELQDSVGEESPLWNEIGDYFNMRELLRRAAQTKNPDVATHESVRIAAQIVNEGKQYVENLVQGEVSDDFTKAISPRALLELTTTNPEAYDDKLAKAAQIFNEVKDLCPKIIANRPIFVGNMLLRLSQKDGKEAVEERLDEAERAITIFMREGYSESQAAYLALDVANGRFEAIPRILDSKGKERLFRTEAVPEADPKYATNEEGTISRRKNAARVRGTLGPEAAGFAARGIEYRDILFDIDESYKIPDAIKRELYSGITRARHDYAVHTFREELALGSEISDAERHLFDEALTDTLYAFKYLLDCGERTQSVQMGSRAVEITPSLSELMSGVRYLERGAHNLASIRLTQTEFTDSNVDTPNTEIGRVQEVDSKALVLTKLRHAAVGASFEQGKSPRIDKIVGITGHWPSYDVKERQKNSLSFRLDRDNDGILRLDIGGKTEDYDAPDFIVARIVSLGRWYRAWLREGKPATQSYHSEITDISEEDFALVAMRYRQSITYTERPKSGPA